MQKAKAEIIYIIILLLEISIFLNFRHSQHQIVKLQVAVTLIYRVFSEETFIF